MSNASELFGRESYAGISLYAPDRRRARYATPRAPR